MRKLVSLCGLLSLAVALGGCGFFTIPATTTGTTPGAATGDYVYVVNPTANTLSGYAVGTNKLTPISGLNPLALQTNLGAQSVAVTRANTYLYVGGNEAINCYAIASDGTLTAVAASQTLVGTADIVSMDTSLDGQFLLAMNGTIPYSVNVYRINTSTGALTPVTASPMNVPLTTILTSPVIKVQPITTASIVVVSTNGAGTESFSFNSSTGALAYVGTVQAANLNDNGVAFDPTGAYVYVARADTLGTGASGISTFAVSSGGNLSGTTALTTTGSAPSSVAFDKSGKYLYAANAGDSSISGYTFSTGTLAALATSPYASSGHLRRLTMDNTGLHMLGVNASGTGDVSLYALDTATAGKLDAGVSVSTGTPGVTALAATH